MNAQQREQADRVMAEAQRRGVPVSEALRDLVGLLSLVPAKNR